jgi:hypothetical protein
MTRVDQGANLYAFGLAGTLAQPRWLHFHRWCRGSRAGKRSSPGFSIAPGFYGVLAEVEALGLDLIEMRRLHNRDYP